MNNKLREFLVAMLMVTSLLAVSLACVFMVIIGGFMLKLFFGL